MSSSVDTGVIQKSSTQKPPSRVTMRWDGDHRFSFGRDGGHAVQIDSDGVAGPSPVDALVGAFASCVSTDIVDILAKRRTPVEELVINAEGVRADAVPARIMSLELTVRLRGTGVERVHAERAIDLAVNKYCSVGSSLDPAIPVSWTLELE